MHVISKKTLVEFYLAHADVKQDLEVWSKEAEYARWKTPKDIKEKYSSASFLEDNKVVFNIHGNKYRLLVRINYNSCTVFIKFIGTHAEYDKLNMEAI